jgi:hypothetical protein
MKHFAAALVLLLLCAYPFTQAAQAASAPQQVADEAGPTSLGSLRLRPRASLSSSRRQESRWSRSPQSTRPRRRSGSIS